MFGPVWMLCSLPSDPVRAFFPSPGNSPHACADQLSAACFTVLWSCFSVKPPLPLGTLCLPWFLWTFCFVSSTHGVCELFQGPLSVLWPGNSLGSDVGNHMDCWFSDSQR